MSLSRRIDELARDADRARVLESAIDWLEKFQPQNSDDPVEVSVRVTYAGSCPGAREAETFLRETLLADWRGVHHRALKKAKEELAELEARYPRDGRAA